MELLSKLFKKLYGANFPISKVLLMKIVLYKSSRTNGCYENSKSAQEKSHCDTTSPSKQAAKISISNVLRHLTSCKTGTCYFPN